MGSGLLVRFVLETSDRVHIPPQHVPGTVRPKASRGSVFFFLKPLVRHHNKERRARAKIKHDILFIFLKKNTKNQKHCCLPLTYRNAFQDQRWPPLLVGVFILAYHLLCLAGLGWLGGRRAPCWRRVSTTPGLPVVYSVINERTPGSNASFVVAAHLWRRRPSTDSDSE